MAYRTVSQGELIQEYCTRQDAEPTALAVRLADVASRFNATGFMLLECHMMDGSRLGEYTILPYGGASTFPAPPDHPVSPRGLASDMSVVTMVCPAN